MGARLRTGMQRSGRLVIAAVLVAAAAFPTGESLAMWSRLTEAELFERSDLIVSGVLVGRTRIRTGATDLTVGVITVQETFKGPPSAIALLVLRADGRPVASDAIARDDGAAGLWYLRLRSPVESGLYVADHPQRFLPAGEAQQAIKDLRRRRD